MKLEEELTKRISENLKTLGPALTATLAAFPLSRAWIEYSWPLAENSTAKPLLVGAKIALLESATSWGIGSNRGAAASLRTFLENFISWLYYKDHPVEYKVMASRDDDLLLPKATKSYLQRMDKNYDKAYAFLAASAKRPSDYYYSDVSQFVHAHPAFAKTSKDSAEIAISVPRDDGFIKLCTHSDEFVSDLYAVFYRHSWDLLPKEIQTHLKSRLTGKLPKFIEL